MIQVLSTKSRLALFATLALLAGVAQAQIIDVDPVETATDTFTGESTCAQIGMAITTQLDFLIVGLETSSTDPTFLLLGIPYLLFAPQTALYDGQAQSGDQFRFRIGDVVTTLDVQRAELLPTVPAEVAMVHPSPEFIDALLAAPADVPVRLQRASTNMMVDRTIPHEVLTGFASGFAEECDYR